MKKIIFQKDFIDQFGLKIENKDNGDIEISIHADFLVYLNHKNIIAASIFTKNKKGFYQDDTLSPKDLLIDQLQYVDYIQKLDKKTSFIDFKFRSNKKK